MAKIKLLYNDTDIYGKVSLNYCVHEMHAEKESDSLVLRFNDPKGQWSSWDPQTGDTVSVEYENDKSGEMFVSAISPQNGLITLRALSMPLGSKSRATKSWESIGFLALCEEVAGKHGLGFENFGVEDQTYDWIAQDNEDDFSFLQRLCNLEGCQMLVYDKKLVVYREKYMEGQDAKGDLEVGINGEFTYSDTRKHGYGKCEIYAGLLSGSATDSDGDPDRVLRAPDSLRVNSAGEADRFAKGLLRNANKYGMTGVFVRSLKTEYAAASILNLKTEKASGWDGKIFLSTVRHDLVKNKTTFLFRKVFLAY